MSTRKLLSAFVLPLLLLLICGRTLPAEITVDEAWEALPGYEYGQDMAPLLTIDRVVIESMTSAENRSRCAAQLAAILEDSQTTPAARQYVCLQLRQIGTPAEVPVLERMLLEPETSQIARYALEAIEGEESLAALRRGLAELEGEHLIGVINSLAARRDAESVAELARLARGNNAQVADVARRALGSIGSVEAAEALLEQLPEAGDQAVGQQLALPLLRCADRLAQAGTVAPAQGIYQRLAAPLEQPNIRRAALAGLLDLQDEQRPATIVSWFAGDDPVKHRVAAGRLQELDDEAITQLVSRLDELPDSARVTVIGILSQRKAAEALPLVMSLARSDDPQLCRSGIRALGMVGDASTVPFLVDQLTAGQSVTAVAQEALTRLPRDAVVPALIETLQTRPEARQPAIEVLIELKAYDAIDPLIALARQPDPATYGPALEGLRGIADPDQHDIPRLLELLLAAEPGRHRDEVEKTILLVCRKHPAGEDPAGPVLTALKGQDLSRSVAYLPLLGRLGGQQSLEIIDEALASDDNAVRHAAVRALCNWPTAEVADRLLEFARHGEDRGQRRAALRAYIRVVSLPSQRPEAETLAMLRQAMQLASEVDDRRLVIERAAAVRTMESVEWIAGFLDEPGLAQTACRSLVELAHHRFLRHPNMERFGPILERVGEITKDAEVRQRAERYRLGL